MEDQVFVVVDEQGHVHSACLHWEGMPRLLWVLLHSVGYLHPPLYEGVDVVEMGVHRCTVTMTIPQHPFHQWPAIATQVTGHRLLDCWERAATTALTTFCEQHPLEVVLTPFGLFPAVDKADPLWQDRMSTSHFLATLDPVGTVCILSRCMNALYHLQVVQGNAIAQLAELAQANHQMVQTRDEFIVDLNGQIDQLEGQVQTLETTVGEHEAMIGFLEEQMQDLNMEVDQANEQLQMQQGQQSALHAPPDVIDVDKEEEPE